MANGQKRTPYQSGKLDITQVASRVNQQVQPQMKTLIAEAAPEIVNASPEQKADAGETASALMAPIQQKVAAARDDNEAAAIVDREKALIQERADIGKRGLSTGERIALAILSSAPLIASAFRGDSNYGNAAQASQQIRKGFIDANEAQKQTEIEQKDVELGRLDKQKALELRQKEQEDERAFMRERDKTKYGYDVALERERQRGALSKEERRAQEGLVKAKKYVINEINKDQLARDSAKALKTFSQFYDVIDNEDGFGDFMASYAAGKLGDPTTGIRDAERTDLMKAGGFLENLRKAPQNFMVGSKFTREAREKFKQAMDDAVSIHYKYLNEGINNRVNALMALDPSLMEANIDPEELVKGTNYDKRNLMSEKALAVMESRQREREMQRYMELKKKAGR
jgi:hypothetical protein